MRACRAAFSVTVVTSFILCVALVLTWSVQPRYRRRLSGYESRKEVTLLIEASGFCIEVDDYDNPRFGDTAPDGEGLIGTRIYRLPFLGPVSLSAVLPSFWLILRTKKEGFWHCAFALACAASTLALVSAIAIWLSTDGLWLPWEREFPVQINRAGYRWMDGDWGSARFYTLKFVEHAGFVLERWVVIPGYWLVAITGVLPAWQGVRLLARIRSRQLGVHNRCGRCGYDLRATPMRCPECGEVRHLL